MHRPWITSGCRCPGPIDKFADPLTIGNLNRIFHQWSRDGDIINFFKPACTLALQRRRPGHKYHRRSFAARLQHSRHRICETFRTNQAHSRFARDTRMTISQMSSNLFMGAVDHRHLTFHKPFERRVTKATSKRKHMLSTFFFECTGEYLATTQFYLFALFVHRIFTFLPIKPT